MLPVLAGGVRLPKFCDNLRPTRRYGPVRGPDAGGRRTAVPDEAPERSDVVVLFGATGDLAKKKIFPSLYLLADSGRLDIPVVGVAKSDWDDAAFRQHAREDVLSLYPKADMTVLDALIGRLSLITGDYSDHDTFEHLADKLSALGTQRPLHYLAI